MLACALTRRGVRFQQKLKHVPRAMSSLAKNHVVSESEIQQNGGLLEFSVVYTDRALNHMSQPFQHVVKDINASMKRAYNTDHTVLIPGSGTYGMEAAARSFGGVGPAAADSPVLVIRNGYFSYRWSQIFDELAHPNVTVLKGRPPNMAGPGLGDEPWTKGSEPSIAPPPIEEVVETIRRIKPKFVAAPHVETSAGIILPKEYTIAIGEACREVDAIFCLDGIASGNAWIDMELAKIDCYLTAPQKGWSGPASSAVVMLNSRAMERARANKCGSFTVNLAKWDGIMQAYLNNGHAYHTTMPTDALRTFRDVVRETEEFGLKKAEAECWRLGNGVRKILADRGFRSLAAPGFEAPGVAVVYAPDGSYAGKFLSKSSFQIAAGVPLMLGPQTEDMSKFTTFRIGLFGLDKLKNVDLALSNFAKGVDQVIA